MESFDDWRRALDATAADILRVAGVVGPPVDALLVASRHCLELAWDARQTGRARLQRIAGQPAIFLKPDERPERLQWAAAHELGEHFAHQVIEALGLQPVDLLPRQREEIANQLASRILLPTDWFVAACRTTAGDLFALKTQFATASYELLAWRRLDQPGARIVTVVDHGQVSRRRCNFAVRAPTPSSAELTAWSECHRTGTRQAVVDSRFALQVWPIHEPQWKREIALTELLDVDLAG